MSHAERFAGVRAITFDAAGTLLHPHPGVGAVYREVALRYGRNYDAAALDRAFRAAFATTRKNPAEPDPETRERDFWKRMVAATVQGAGAELPLEFDRYFAAVWEEFARGTRWRVSPRVSETLAALRSRGYRLAVLSNWDRRLHRVLDEATLRPLFDAVVISSEVGADKPEAKIFRAAERLLATTADQCLHIGDSRTHDYDGARAAGWQALLVRHDGGPEASDSIGDIGQLPGVLSDLRRAS